MFFIKETMAVSIVRSWPHEIDIAELKFNGFLFIQRWICWASSCLNMFLGIYLQIHSCVIYLRTNLCISTMALNASLKVS